MRPFVLSKAGSRWAGTRSPGRWLAVAVVLTLGGVDPARASVTGTGVTSAGMTSSGGAAESKAGSPEARLVSVEVEPELGSWSAWLDNGVRLHAMRVGGRPGQVVVTLRLAGGSAWEDAGSDGLTDAAVFELDRLLTQRLGRDDTRLRNSPDHVDLRWMGPADELERQLGAIAAVLRGPIAADAGSVAVWRRGAQQAIGRSAPIELAASHAMWSAIASGGLSPRVPPSAGAIARVTPERVSAWATRLADAPMEVAIVGDVDPDRAMAVGLATLGTLATRERIGREADASDAVELAAGPWRRASATVERDPGMSMVLVGVVTSDLRDLAASRALLVGTEIASARLEARSKTPAEAGGPLWDRVDVFSWPIGMNSDVGVFALVGSGPAGTGERIERDLRAVLDELVSEGPTESEVREASRLHIQRLAARRSDPGFWADAVLGGSTFYGRDVSRVLDLEASYAAVTAPMVRETLASFLRERGGVSVIIESTPPRPTILRP